MEITIFMDESGRTGKQKFSNGKWNFSNQPLFGLGALYIQPENISNLVKSLDKIISKENFQGEFKWSNKAAKNRSKRLIPSLIKAIEDNGGKIYFEIEEKKFSISKYITETCIFPFYDSCTTLENIHDFDKVCFKRAFASFVCDTVSDNLLGEICSFLDSGEHNTSKLKEYIKKLINESKSKILEEFCMETIDSIEHFERGEAPWNLENMFSVIDHFVHNKNDDFIAVDAHTDCFSDLLNHSKRLFPSAKSVKCIHDEQNQWKLILKSAIERLNNPFLNNTQINYQLDFKSGYDSIINVVDYILGYIKEWLTKFYTNKKTENPYVLKLCNKYVTLVSNISFQGMIFPNNLENSIVRDIVVALYL